METIVLKDISELKELMEKSEDNTIFRIELSGGDESSGEDRDKDSQHTSC